MIDKNFSLIIPFYNDSNTIECLVERCIDFFNINKIRYEIIIVNDNSPDNYKNILNKLSKLKNLKIIKHHRNMGYGAAIKTGLKHSSYDQVITIDGDNEYDIFECEKFLKLINFYPLIITFRYKKLYSTKRIFISYIYNFLIRFFFKSHFRDISTGLRFFNKKILSDITHGLSNSPFFGAELAIKSMLEGFPVGEVGIQTFPRQLSKGNSISINNIYLTIKDLSRVYSLIFSDEYRLPKGRIRKKSNEKN